MNFIQIEQCEVVFFNCKLWFFLRPEVLKTALVKAVEKGQLEQITGKGARGTFQVKHFLTPTLSDLSLIEVHLSFAMPPP